RPGREAAPARVRARKLRRCIAMSSLARLIRALLDRGARPAPTARSRCGGGAWASRSRAHGDGSGARGVHQLVRRLAGRLGGDRVRPDAELPGHLLLVEEKRLPHRWRIGRERQGLATVLVSGQRRDVMAARSHVAPAMTVDAAVADRDGLVDVQGDVGERGQRVRRHEPERVLSQRELANRGFQLFGRSLQEVDERANGPGHDRGRRTVLEGVLAQATVEGGEPEEVLLVVQPDDDDRLVGLELLSLPEPLLVANVRRYQVVAVANL